MIEWIYEVAKLDHRNTDTETMRLLIEFGLGVLEAVRYAGLHGAALGAKD